MKKNKIAYGFKDASYICRNQICKASQENMGDIPVAVMSFENNLEGSRVTEIAMSFSFLIHQ